jgi:hypothetical protein
VNVPLGLALIPLALLRLSESHGPNPSLDLVGTALVSGGLFGIVYALVRGNADGWTSARSWAASSRVRPCSPASSATSCAPSTRCCRCVCSATVRSASSTSPAC